MLDRVAAQKLIAVAEVDLNLMTLVELQMMKEHLERISAEASAALEHALLVREKEVGDGETYNGMIQVRRSCFVYQA